MAFSEKDLALNRINSVLFQLTGLAPPLRSEALNYRG